MKKFSFHMMVSLLLISFAALANANDWFKQQGVDYHETAEPGKFLLEWMKQEPAKKNGVILLDLDDTVFSTPPGKWLRPNIYYDLRQEQAAKHPELTFAEAGHRVNPLLVTAFLQLPYKLTDKQITKAINRLKKEGFTILGFTSREKDVIPDTLKWLKRLKVNFSQELAEETITMGEGKHPLIIENGVVFAGNNKKGDALAKLLSLGKLGKPETIVFIDDRSDHLKTTTEAIVSAKQNIHFVPVLCTYPEVAFKPYDKKQVGHALLSFLVDKQKQKKIGALLDSDAYTYEFVTEQCTTKSANPDSLPLCTTLKTTYCTKQNKENVPLCKSMMTVAR